MSTLHELEVTKDGVTYNIQFEILSYGSPAHMGSLTYAGDPGDPPEWDVAGLFLVKEEGDDEEMDASKYPELVDSMYDDVATYISELALDDDIDWIE